MSEPILTRANRIAAALIEADLSAEDAWRVLDRVSVIFEWPVLRGKRIREQETADTFDPAIVATIAQMLVGVGEVAEGWAVLDSAAEIFQLPVDLARGRVGWSVPHDMDPVGYYEALPTA